MEHGAAKVIRLEPKDEPMRTATRLIELLHTEAKAVEKENKEKASSLRFAKEELEKARTAVAQPQEQSNIKRFLNAVSGNQAAASASIGGIESPALQELRDKIILARQALEKFGRPAENAVRALEKPETKQTAFDDPTLYSG